MSVEVGEHGFVQDKVGAYFGIDIGKRASAINRESKVAFCHTEIDRWFCG